MVLAFGQALRFPRPHSEKTSNSTRPCPSALRGTNDTTKHQPAVYGAHHNTTHDHHIQRTREDLVALAHNSRKRSLVAQCRYCTASALSASRLPHCAASAILAFGRLDMEDSLIIVEDIVVHLEAAGRLGGCSADKSLHTSSHCSYCGPRADSWLNGSVHGLMPVAP